MGGEIGAIAERRDVAVREAQFEAAAVLAIGIARRAAHRDDGAAGKEAKQIHEMTGFADDASPALLGIKRPVVSGQATGVDVDREAARTGLGAERGAQADGERGEAPVEADGEDPGRRTRHGQRGVEVILGERERLLDPDMLVGAERRAGQCAVFGMTGGDEDLIDARIVERRGHIGGRRRGGPGEQLRRKAVGRDEGRRRRALATELRHEHAGGEVAATDDGVAAYGAAVPIRARRCADERLVRDGVLDEQAVGTGATQVIVDLRSRRQRVAGSQQRGHIEGTRSHQGEDFGEVGPGG